MNRTLASNSLVEPEVPEGRQVGRDAFGAGRLGAEVVQVQEHVERRVTGTPRGFVERIRVGRRGVQLDVQGRVRLQEPVIDDRTEWVRVARRLRADDDTQGLATLAGARLQGVQQLPAGHLPQLVEYPQAGR